jgi:hypothetical protein
MSSGNDIEVEPTVRSRRPRTKTARRQAKPKRRRPFRRALSLGLLALLPFVVIAGLAVAVVYVRLTNGPISLTFLKPAVENQISTKLGGLKVSVADVLLSLEDHGAELKLENVRVDDGGAAPVASAPYAAVQIDKTALLRGEISPSGITLIRPRIHVAYTEANGLSLSFAEAQPGPSDRGAIRPQEAARRGQGWEVEVHRADKPSQAAPAAAPEVTASNSAAAAPSAPPMNAQSVFELLAAYVRDVARTDTGSGGLDRMGVRNALIVVDYMGRRSVWGVPSSEIDIKRAGGGVEVSGLTSIADAGGNNATLAFTAETSGERRQVALSGSVRDVRPAFLAQLVPGIDQATALDAPVFAEGSVNLDPAGHVIDGRLTIEVQKGALRFPREAGMAPVQLDHGRIDVAFEKGRETLTIQPSALAWGGGNEMRFEGNLAPTGDGSGAWSYALEGLDGRLTAASGGDARPVDAWSARGRIDAARGRYLIDEADISIAGLRAVFDSAYETPTDPARSPGDAAVGQIRLSGRVSPGPLTSLMFLWPENIAVDARAWMSAHVAGGRLTEGRVAYRWPPAAVADGQSNEMTSVALSGEGIALAGIAKSGPVVASKALLRMTNEALEIAIPEAALSIKGGQPLALRQVRFEIDDVWRPDVPARLGTGVEGSLRSVARVILSQASLDPAKSARLALIAERASGSMTGKLEMAVPIYAPAGTPSPRPVGDVRITGAGLKDAVGGHDLSGGQFAIQLGSKVITARGDMRIDGVATKVDWHHIYDAEPGRQPPVRLRARLDEADRDKLGIHVNHILRGVLDAEMLLKEAADGSLRAEARVDAKNAQISVESLAWVKPAGSDTLIDFEIVPDAKSGMSLEKLRIAGDGIAIQGRATLDKSFAMRAFEFPSFSIDRVTRLSIEGRLARNNIWRVDVKGQTYEGSSLFRSLFNAGRVKGGLHSEHPDQPGVDLQAQVQTVLGFWSARLSDVRMTLSKRKGQLEALELEGQLAAGGRLRAALVKSPAGRRELHAYSSNAGEAFRLVGFYPNAHRGSLELVVDMDRRGATEKSGVLLVRKFDILGDAVVREMASAPSSGVRRRRAAREAAAMSGQALPFDWMRLPFLVGNGQFILRSAELRGPVVGATIEGKADFDARAIDLSGTYVPLQGLNGAIGVIPGLGQILAGPKGEGVLGMKFAVRGPMAQPEVLVNPLSLMAPGIFREIFQISNPSLEVTGRAAPAAERPAERAAPNTPPSGEGRRGWARRAFGESN